MDRRVKGERPRYRVLRGFCWKTIQRPVFLERGSDQGLILSDRIGTERGSQFVYPASGAGGRTVRRRWRLDTAKQSRENRVDAPSARELIHRDHRLAHRDFLTLGRSKRGIRVEQPVNTCILLPASASTSPGPADRGCYMRSLLRTRYPGEARMKVG